MANLTLPWTYSGLLDDALLRYGTHLGIDDTFFQRAILRSVLFNGPILLNDGYIFNEGIGAEQILNEDSLLRVMTRNGYVRILSRSADLDPEGIASIPEQLAKRGVSTARKRIDSASWPQEKEAMLRWAVSMVRTRNIDPWPNRQINVGMKFLFDRLFDDGADDLGISTNAHNILLELQEKLSKSEQYLSAPRSAIEDQLLAFEELGVSDRNITSQIMAMANQAYHYNISMCLNEEYDMPVVADTTIGRAFDNLLEMPRSIEASIDEVDAISIPRGFPMDQPQIFDKLIDDSTELYSHKENFLKSIDAVSKSGNNFNVDDKIREAKRASTEYRKHLASHFGNFISIGDLAPGRSALVGWFFSTGGGRLAVGAGVASLAANLAGRNNRLTGFVDRATREFNTRLVEIGLDPSAGERKKLMDFKIGDVTPRFSSVAFNEGSIREHLESVPRFSSDAD